MLISFFVLVVFAQWAVCNNGSATAHRHLARFRRLIAIAIVNAQAYVYNQMALPAADSIYAVDVLRHHRDDDGPLVVGLVFTTVVTAFRLLGERRPIGKIVAAHALYWYVLTVAFSALWLIVYVSK